MTHMTYSTKRVRESGIISGTLVAIIGLSVLVVALGSFSIWAFVAYNEAKSDVDGKINLAVVDAKQKQSDVDEEKYFEKEKTPTKKFTAPDDYCGLTFQYPKTWSAFQSEQITNGGDYKAYLNPDVVPPISNSQQFALRVLIEQKDYDVVMNQYQGLVQKGALKQSTANSLGNQGARLTGDFSNDIRGDAVIYQCRDKTITLRTDADAFKKDFDALIRTINFNA